MDNNNNNEEEFSDGKIINREIVDEMKTAYTENLQQLLEMF